MNLHRFAQKIFAVWMALFFLMTPVLGAQVAHAQVSILGDVPRTLEEVKTAILKFITSTMQAAIVTTLVNVASYAADRVAYDAAVWVASGGNAEEPLYNPENSSSYLESLGQGIAGEAIGSLSDTIEGAGGLLSNFDLCAPSSPYILLQFKLGIKGVFDRPTPKCDFNKMFGPDGTWASFVAEYSGDSATTKNQAILTELANMYDPQTSEFSAGLQLQTDIFGEATFKSLVGVQSNIKNDGFKPVTDFITKYDKTPASIVESQVTEAQKKSGDVRQQATFSMLGNKDLIISLGVHFASVFTNTLQSKLQERIWQGLFDFNTTQVDPFDPASFALNTSADAAEQYRSLLAVAPLQITNYSILSDFITCPGDDSRGLYNCVADSNFVSAVARSDAGASLTIAEAIDEGLVDGSWPLIPSGDVARNQDAYCYTYGFCYGNLVKLRKARVISLGWELAANSSANSIESPATLQEVLDGFNSCGSDGLPDENHPWCKMIDPDWVLKYPDTQCRMQTYGEMLIADQTNERGQACVDMPSCISEDENGNCVGGYGYCVAEENTWRFRGESCPEYAASCLSFEDSEGTQLSLLKNTVDPGPCTADTVGCRWYATQKTEQEDGSFAYAAVESVSSADASEDTYTSRIYLNSQVEDCDEEDGSCSTLIERPTDLRLNAVFNPSFEQDDDSDDHPDGWYEYHDIFKRSWASEISSDGSYSRDGEVAVSPGEASSGNGALYQPGIELGQARTYTLSFYARQLEDSGIDTIRVMLDLKDEEGTGIDISGLAMSGDCDDSYTDIFGVTRTTGVAIEYVEPDDTNYQRFSCTFTVPPLSDSSLRVFGDLYLLNFDGYVDSVQLEQGEDVSTAVDGYSDTDYSTLVAKVPPSYLGCTGESDDPEECANYARVCSEQDIGCTLYTPTNGDPSLSGIATELDACPSECVGYDTYRQEATLYEPSGIDSVYLIPDTATECSAEDVGCDEFTNLSNEDQEYYSFLRACVTSEQASTDSATYYTWEGSDESGYQLRTWTLLQSNLGPSNYTHIGADGDTDTAPDQAPCSKWVTTNDGISCNDAVDSDGDSYYDWDSEECNTRADIFTNPDCREFYDESGEIHYRNWQNTVTVNDACQSYRKTDIAGDTVAEQTATCEDSGGYYVSDSGECRYYGFSTESTSCDEAANGCRAYAGGRSRNSRLVLEELFEEGTLNQWDAASASDATYSNESLASDGHSMLMTGPVTSFAFDNGTACTSEEGCDGTARSFGGECTVANGSTYCGTLDNELYAGKTYTVSVVAKGTGTLEVGFDFEADSSAPEADLAFDSAVELEDGWQVLTLGPLVMDASEYPLFGEGTSLVLIPTGTAYVDNIVLREGEENLTLIRDSWVTPATCDQSITGADSPQYYLGCQEYTTQDGDTAYLKSFSSLCDEDKVGCDAFFKTQESASTTAETYHATCNNIDDDGDGIPDTATSATACYYFESSTGFDTTSPYLCTISVGESSCLFSQDGFTPSWKMPSHLSYGPESVVVPGDEDMFLVVTDDVTCASDTAGCTELGDPQWSQDRESTTGADSVYLINLPDTYDSILCAHDELFCDAFTATDATTYYFKHPLDQTCEYKTDVTVDGVLYSGWFREGTSDFCYGTCEDSSGNEGSACGSSADCSSDETCDAGNPSYVIGGTESGIWKNGDEDFSNWAGTCSANYDTCTEFQDKLAQDDGDIYGQTDGTSYFYLNNDTLSETGLSDSQKCDGQVSLKNGCAMFYDTGDTSFTANASATEIASRHADILFGSEPYGLVDPIDCENGGDTTITTASGDQVDLCASRCTYDYGEVYDLTDGVTYKEKLTDERRTTNEYGKDDMYIFGGSCYDATDCPLVRSESGADVEAISCATQVRVDPFSSSSSFGGKFTSWKLSLTPQGFEAVPRQEDDVNTTLKVNRDRSCAEWLSCSSTQTQWDEASASFKTTCNDIELCTDYDATTGSSFCSKWDFEKPEVVYNKDWYATRDTSWYGNEYSGMAIPNLFPVQALTQADVSRVAYCSNGLEGVCENVGDECTAGGTCISPDDAIAAGIIDKADYALVLNAGECSQDYGESCAVGYCEETGAACATSDQCSSGSCLVGSCYTVDTAALCQTAEDCNEGQTCYGGACADIGSDVPIEEYDAATATATTCTTTETFVEDASMKLGSCINDACLLTPSGDQYTEGSSEGKICRAYPENNSPFPNDVVESWYNPADPGTIADSPSADALPYSTVSGFENTVTCAYGEDCDCSYTKVTYGTGAATRYYGMDWESPHTGICQGGDTPGLTCTADGGECGEGATCEPVTREDVIYGMNGFCLEKDTSTNILGDRAKSACISWLPVDQLAGDTDLNAKYITAGYFDDTFVCADVKPVFDVGVSSISTTSDEMACAETTITDCTADNSYEDLPNCLEHAACPDGFFAIVGQCAANDSDYSMYYANACTRGENDCPYVCVPSGSYRTSDNSECDPSTTDWSYEGTGANDTPVYAIGSSDIDEGLQLFDDTVNSFASCIAKGVEYTNDSSDAIYGFPSSTYSIASGCEEPNSENDLLNQGDDGYRCLSFLESNSTLTPYLACNDVVQVIDAASGTGYAWTDRVYMNSWALSGDYSSTAYTASTGLAPFGGTNENPGQRSGIDGPQTIATCAYDDAGNEETDTLYLPNGSDLSQCEDPYYLYAEKEEVAPDSADMRAFADMNLFIYEHSDWDSRLTVNGSYDDVFGLITQAYANIDLGIGNEVYEWNGEVSNDFAKNFNYTNIFDASELNSMFSDQVDVRATGGNPPTIWSVNTQSCSDDGAMCEEGVENRITLNGDDSGDQSGTGFFTATIKFFAAADKNQLPIRRIRVDWGDDIDGGSYAGSDADDNFFKNARGLQDGTQTSKCDLNTEWGLTEESCSPYYYSYDHVYTCSSEILRDSTAACEDLNADGSYDSFPCWIDQTGDAVADACVFKPRVHVRDNWGWCSGTCTDGNAVDASESSPGGCFAGVDNGINDSTKETRSECSYERYPDTNADINPWVDYSGTITVTP